jgi:MerR family mercuric resistance operon transcriptional regulator
LAAQFSSARRQSGSGVKVETIRFYQHRGLFEGPEKSIGGIRAQVHVRRIRFVREAQESLCLRHQLNPLLRISRTA